MTISFSCDHCGKKYATPGEFAGKALKCKQCSTILRIPAPSPPPPAPKSTLPPKPAAPKPPEDDLYELEDAAPIALTEADAIDSDDAIPIARPAGVRRTWGKPAPSTAMPGSSPPEKNPRRAPRTASSGVAAKSASAGVGGLVVLFWILRIVRIGHNAINGGADDAPTPPPAPVFAAQTSGSAAASLVDARRGFRTNLVRRESANEPVAEPPSDVFRVVKYDSPAGSLAAYLSPDPGDGKKHPAIIWITGGDCATIGDVWSPASPDNDQSARAFRESGIVMMFPSLRGGNTNPGVHEGFLGEVDDVLAARDFLAGQEFVDPSRIYLGGHSTGGTLALLAAASTDRFRAVFSFGPVDDVSGYGPEFNFASTSDPREVAIRSPIHWLGSVRCPTFVIEGTGGNISSLRSMSRASRNPSLHFCTVNGANHFNVLAPSTRFLAQKVLADAGPSANSLFQPGDLQRAFRH